VECASHAFCLLISPISSGFCHVVQLGCRKHFLLMGPMVMLMLINLANFLSYHGS
jgi:hypothetical protein